MKSLMATFKEVGTAGEEDDLPVMEVVLSFKLGDLWWGDFPLLRVDAVVDSSGVGDVVLVEGEFQGMADGNDFLGVAEVMANNEVAERVVGELGGFELLKRRDCKV